jgi:nitrite reductase (NADH) small subunit
MEACAYQGAEYLLLRTGDAVYALSNECPHAGGPLAMGVFRPPLVACPWHAWEFDCRTGQCVHSAKARVPVYPVEIREGRVWVRLPGVPAPDA